MQSRFGGATMPQSPPWIASSVPTPPLEGKDSGEEHLEGYAKASLKKYRPIAARNEDKKIFSGLL